MSGLKDDSDFKAGEFKGRVESSLKTIARDIGEIKEEAKTNNTEIKKEMRRIREKVNNNRFKIAGIGATVSLIVTIGILLLRELIK